MKHIAPSEYNAIFRHSGCPPYHPDCASSESEIPFLAVYSALDFISVVRTTGNLTPQRLRAGSTIFIEAQSIHLISRIKIDVSSEEMSDVGLYCFYYGPSFRTEPT